MYYLTKEQMYAVDHYTIEKIGIPDATLMENAGQAITRELMQIISPDQKIAILCGHGNNGGDGITIGRILKSHSFSFVNLILIPAISELKGAAKEHFHIYSNCGYHSVFYQSNELKVLEYIADSDVIIDALMGIGFHGTPRPPYDSIINAVNTANSQVYAVDIPSGIEANTDHFGVAIQANITFTIQYPKESAVLDSSKPYYCDIQTVDIGIPPIALQKVLKG